MRVLKRAKMEMDALHVEQESMKRSLLKRAEKSIKGTYENQINLFI
jgi:hypothetical protein